MKKQLTVLGISVLIITGAAFTAYAQQKENKGKKEQKQDQDQDKNNGKGNQDKKNDNSAWDKNKGQSKNKENGQGKGNNNGNDNDGYKNKDNRGNNNSNNEDNKNKDKDKDKDNKNDKDGYSWNQENFKDRKKLKDQEKVTICHKVKNNNEPGVTLRVSSNATKAHMNHGDVMGECATATNSKFSNVFLEKRNNYYNTLQNSYEQVSYSRSILDYAVERLTNSRLQLTNMQNSNVPRAELERKQATVVELEQNVSLLETLIGVTANIVVNKLQQ